MSCESTISPHFKSINVYDSYLAQYSGLFHLPSPPIDNFLLLAFKDETISDWFLFHTELITGCRKYFWSQKNVNFEIDAKNRITAIGNNPADSSAADINRFQNGWPWLIGLLSHVWVCEHTGHVCLTRRRVPIVDKSSVTCDLQLVHCWNRPNRHDSTLYISFPLYKNPQWYQSCTL